MSKMDDFPNHVVLKGMIFHGHTGVFPFEKEDGQPFIVDLTLAISPLPALFSDQLEDTVSYADIYACVKKIVENGRYDLLERLSMAVLEEVFAFDGRIEAADISVMKPKAPIEGTFDAMGVRLFRQRGCL